MFVLSAVCISDSSTVPAEYIPKPEEILFMFIIAVKNKPLIIALHFFKNSNYSTLKFTFLLVIFQHYLLQYHEIIKDNIGEKERSLNWDIQCL